MAGNVNQVVQKQVVQTQVVKICDLHFSYENKPILSGVNLSVQAGKITAILGPSGVGKTSILRLIGAQLTPNAGTVLVNGHNIHQLSRNCLYKQRRKMGMLFQQSALFTHMSVFENVAFPLKEHTELTHSMIRDIVLMKLEAVGLRGAGHLKPNELSGGMARRVALARALALDPNLMMYDEPFTGQDPISMAVLMRLIKNLNEILGMSSIIVSHDVQETMSIADYVYIFSNGQVIGEGKPDQLLEAKQSPMIHQFIQGLADGVIPFHYPAKAFDEDLLHG